VAALAMKARLDPAWLIPQWPAPARVHAIFTTRAGGQSVAPYDALNLGTQVGDSAAYVEANRRVLQRATGVRPVFLSQVHGAQTVLLSEATPDASAGDGWVTDQPGLACSILVADCLPVLLTNLQGSAVAAAHAGWRGLAGSGGRGIMEQICESFMALGPVYNAQSATNIIAWLGPCIGPQVFEVGDEVRTAFVANDLAAAAMFRPTGLDRPVAARGQKWLADLQGLARLRLRALGVTQIFGNDGSSPWCTVSNPSSFF
jgi:hypothetical protein